MKALIATFHNIKNHRYHTIPTIKTSKTPRWRGVPHLRCSARCWTLIPNQQQGWFTSKKPLKNPSDRVFWSNAPKLRLRHLCPQLLGWSNWGNFEDLLMGGIRGPVELGSLSPLWRFLYVPGGWPWDFWIINSIKGCLERTTFFDLSSMLCFNDSLELDIEASLRSSFLLNCLCVLPRYEVGKCWQWNGSHSCSQHQPLQDLHLTTDVQHLTSILGCKSWSLR